MMQSIKPLALKVAHHNLARAPRKAMVFPGLRRRAFPGREINFYFLSTGRVGTRFFSKVLGTATNATVLHQPSPSLKETVVRDVVRTFHLDPDAFWRLRIEDFLALEEKVLRQMTYGTAVYGDTLNHMFPFGHMLYRHFGRDRVRLVHLIRNPVDCGRSTLKAERDDTGRGRFTELRPPEFLTGASPAEKAAGIWNGVNGMIREQFERIDDPSACRVIRLEDISLKLVEELFDFLHLDGFDAKRIETLMNDRSHDVRHSHLSVNRARPDATPEELELIERLCAPLAANYGYSAG